MQAERLKALRILLILTSLVWIAGSIWLVFVNAPDDAFLTKESPEILDRMDRECVGSYQERYNCKNSIAIEASNHAFWEGFIRFVIVVSGPILGASYYGWLVTRQPPLPPRPIQHDDLDWKKSAKAHVSRTGGHPTDE